MIDRHDRAMLQLVAREMHVDVVRTVPANAVRALDSLGIADLAPPEVRRLTDAFGGGAQWAILVALPHGDLADSLGGYEAIFQSLAAACSQRMGWQYTIITISWPSRPPPGPSTAYLTMVYDLAEEVSATL